MNLKKYCLLFAALSVTGTPAFAYTVYNKLDHSIQVKDRHGLSGMNVTMTPQSSTACNPTSRGCYGKISFNIYTPQVKNKVICNWYGTIKKGPGNYFVISPVAGKNYPEQGSCAVEYYHD